VLSLTLAALATKSDKLVASCFNVKNKPDIAVVAVGPDSALKFASQVQNFLDRLAARQTTKNTQLAYDVDCDLGEIFANLRKHGMPYGAVNYGWHGVQFLAVFVPGENVTGKMVSMLGVNS
jgi:hypothetical protein